MESTRLNKIGRLIQKELGDIFQKQTQGMPKKGKSYWNRSVQIPKRSVSIWVNV